MPRPDFRNQSSIAKNYDLNAGGDQYFSGGLARENVHGVAVVMTANASSQGTIRGDLRSPAGTGTVTQGYFFTMTIPANAVAGQTIYVENIRRILNRGDEMVITITSGAGAGATGHLSLWHEPEYEMPANNNPALIAG